MSGAGVLLPVAALTWRLEGLSPVEQTPCSSEELVVVLGFRWDVRNVYSVPCSQENDSGTKIRMDKDHVLPGIIIHRIVVFSKRGM